MKDRRRPAGSRTAAASAAHRQRNVTHSDEELRSQIRAYIDRHGWDVAENDAAWRQYQRRNWKRDYAGEDW